MVDIQNRDTESKKVKQVKSKSKIIKITTLESAKSISKDKFTHHLPKNNEIKSKGKNPSRAKEPKETIRSRGKNLKAEATDE